MKQFSLALSLPTSEAIDRLEALAAGADVVIDPDEIRHLAHVVANVARSLNSFIQFDAVIRGGEIIDNETNQEITTGDI